MLAREHEVSCAVFWFVLDDINFQSMNSISHGSFLFWAYVRIQLTCLSFCHLTSLLRSSSWLMLCYRGNLLHFIWLCPLWARLFLPISMHNFTVCAVSFRVTSWFITLPLMYFFLFTFFPHSCFSSRGCLSCNSVHCPCNFLFLIWLLLPMLFPIIGPFIFRVMGFRSPVLASGLVLCARVILPSKNSRM